MKIEDLENVARMIIKETNHLRSDERVSPLDKAYTQGRFDSWVKVVHYIQKIKEEMQMQNLFLKEVDLSALGGRSAGELEVALLEMASKMQHGKAVEIDGYSPSNPQGIKYENFSSKVYNLKKAGKLDDSFGTARRVEKVKGGKQIARFYFTRKPVFTTAGRRAA